MTRKVKLFVLILSLISIVSIITACSGVKFSVDFMVDGKVYASVDTSGQEIVEMPKNPTKKGYVFDGWYWDEGTWEKPFTANSILDAPLSSDMAVYAKWITSGEANNNKHKHSYLEEVTAPTCMASGFTTFTCECGDSYVDNYVEPIEHKFIKFKDDHKPGHADYGNKSAYCEYGCGTKYTEKKGDSNAKHNFENYFYNNDATCLENGTETARCEDKKCEATNTREKLGSAFGGHNFQNYYYNNDSRPNFNGTETARCENPGCEETHTRVLGTGETWDEDSHLHVYTNYIYNNDAKCGVDGTETATCDIDRCMVTDTRSKVGTKLSHVFGNYVYNKDAKCDVDGTETGTCINPDCSVNDIRTAVGTALKHVYTNYKYNNDAKCGVDGTETATCDNLGCKSTDQRTATNTRLKHEFSSYSENNDATCSDRGTKTAKCDHGCGEINITYSDAPLKAHIFKTFVSNGDATCFVNGTKTALCEYNCGTVKTIEDPNTKLTHKFERYTFNNDATCTLNGTETASCVNNCGMVDIREKADSKTDHDFVEYVYNNDARCGIDGTETATCSRSDCNAKDVRRRQGTALSHKFTIYNYDGNARCGIDGTETAICDSEGCEETHVRQSVGSALTHIFNTYTFNNDATCTINGTETAQCAHGCGTVEKRTKENSATGHNFINYETKIEATCDSDRVEISVCSNGSCKVTNTITIPNTATGHNWSAYTYNNDAKCGVDGTATATCDSCGKTSVQIMVGTALTHSFTQYVPDGAGSKTASCDHGCGATDTVIDENYSEEEPAIVFLGGLLVGENNEIKDVVANAVTEYAFTTNVQVLGGATYGVYQDIGCTTEILSKTIELQAGDNQCYILAKLGSENVLYKVIIRRKPIYAVTFNTNGAGEVEPQSVEEGNFAVAPSVNRYGYDFIGWSYDFSQPIMQDVNVFASWEARIANYSIRYYLENVENDEYTLYETRELNGVIGSNVNADINWYPNFTVENQNVSGTILEDGTLILDVYYQRNEFTVTFNLTYGTAFSNVTYVNGPTIVSVKYQGTAIAPEFRNDGYHFRGFNRSLENITANTTIYAQWDAIFTWSGNTITGLTSYGRTIKELEIPSKIAIQTITSINDQAFVNGTMTKVVVSDSIERIGVGAFKDCRYIQEMTLPFVGEKEVTSSNLLDHAKFGYIFSETWNNGFSLWTCYSYIPASLKSVTITKASLIGSYAFYKCNNITNITLAENTTTIGSFAFAYCENATVEIPAKVNSFVQSSFREGPKEVIIDSNNANYKSVDGAIYTKDGTKLISYFDKEATSFTALSTTKTIGEYAFYNCTNLKEIIIPNSVTAIETQAFRGCSKLESITLPFVGASSALANSYDEVFGFIFGYTTNTTGEAVTDAVMQFTAQTETTDSSTGTTKTTTTYYHYYIPNTLKNVTINGGGTITDKDFNHVTWLTSLTLGSGVSNINVGALKSLGSLNSLTIPFVGTSPSTTNAHEQVFGSIFGYTTSLLSTMSDKVMQYSKSTTSTDETTGESTQVVLYYHYNVPSTLKEVTVSGGKIYSNAFINCTTITTLNVGSEVSTVYANAFTECNTSIFTIEDDIKYVGNGDNPFLVAVGYDGTKSSIVLHRDCKMVAINAFSSSLMYSFYSDNTNTLELRTIMSGVEMKNTWGSVVEKKETYTSQIALNNDDYARAAYGGAVQFASYFTMVESGNSTSSWYVTATGGSHSISTAQAYINYGTIQSAMVNLPGGTTTFVGNLTLSTLGKAFTQQIARAENCGVRLFKRDTTAPEIRLEGNTINVFDNMAGIKSIKVTYINLQGNQVQDVSKTFIASGISRDSYVTERSMVLSTAGRYTVTAIDNLGNVADSTLEYYEPTITLSSCDPIKGLVAIGVGDDVPTVNKAECQLSNVPSGSTYNLYAIAQLGYYFDGWTETNGAYRTLGIGSCVANGGEGPWKQTQTIAMNTSSTLEIKWRAEFKEIATLLVSNGSQVVAGTTSFDYLSTATGSPIDLRAGDLPEGYSITISYNGTTHDESAYESTVAPGEKGHYTACVNVLYNGNVLGCGYYNINIL